ncbi:MAG: TSCPD domain-containing protein [Clostridiales bacterium]|nr:TSCPD domain-containing protein [Clostridiales bacterium]
MISENGLKVLKKRYLAKDINGDPIETPDEMFRRISTFIASADKIFEPEKNVEIVEDKFYEIMSQLEFLPNSPTLMNAGRELGQLSACFVLPVEDSMEGIFDAIKHAAIIHKSGGGTGFSFSRLRSKGSSVNSTGGVASGPISFMKVFNSATEAVKQGGVRRGANMGILRVDHPDIIEFIQCKEKDKEITNFNISIGITEEFMEAVEKDEEYELIEPHTKKAVGKLKAKEVFELIIDMAWNNGEPGIIFLDRMNRDNIVPELGEIESTNPCVTGDTWILSVDGPEQVKNIIGRKTGLALNGIFYESDNNGFFKTGTKDVIKIDTDRGYSITVTKDHLIRTASDVSRSRIKEDWKPAGDLVPGDKIVLSNNRGLKWSGKGTYNEGFLLGSLLGDGTLKKEAGIISVWGDDEETESLLEAVGYAASTLPHRSDFRGFRSILEDRHEHRLKMSALRDLALDYDITQGKKTINNEVERTGSDFYCGLLRGLFDADGTVIGTQKKGASIRLWQNDLEALYVIQRMLLRLGIASQIYADRKPSAKKMMPDGKGGYKLYNTKSGHELVISGDNLSTFNETVGFGSSKKQGKLTSLLEDYKRALNRERFVTAVKCITELEARDVYDVQVPGVNAFDANGIYVHNCGEQPLLPFESCNLGSINLLSCIKENEKGKYLDYEKLGELVDASVHFLDNVIEMNKYPLKTIDEMTKKTRKIGLGVMGFADMLIELNIPYDSDEGIKTAESVMGFIDKRSKNASKKLAEIRGTFPTYNKSIYAKNGIKLRNATTTTIAPTGTISIIAGVSSGIEPLFAISFIRNVMDNDELPEVNPLFEKIAKEKGFYSIELMRRIAESGSISNIKEIPEDIRRIFVTAHDIDPVWHIKMQAVFQKYTDNAVSKTVNFKNEATKDDVRDVYLHAYRLGCKGVTIYRDGSRDSQVLNIGAVNKNDNNIKEAEEPKVLKARVRPDVTIGITEKIKIGCGNLYVTVNSDDNGICEVFANLGRAGGCPSQSEATSRLISIALRAGVDIKEIIEQLRGIRCHTTLRQKGLKVLSCPDAIGRTLEKVLNLQVDVKDVETIHELTKAVDKESNGCNGSSCGTNNGCSNGHNCEVSVTSESGMPWSTLKACPDCGSHLQHEGGCVICMNCGFSKCG